jgi:ribosome maturation factor RimP
VPYTCNRLGHRVSVLLYAFDLKHKLLSHYNSYVLKSSRPQAVKDDAPGRQGESKGAPFGAFLLGSREYRRDVRHLHCKVVTRDNKWALRPFFVSGAFMDTSGLAQLIKPVVEGMGYELWGCEYLPRRRRGLLRVYIDRQEGVSLDDCGRVSHQLSGVLDVEDPIGASYMLEVSSPGLDRLLLKPDHFRRFAGEQVKIKLKWRIDGRRNFAARLLGVKNDQVLIDEQETRYSIPLAAIERARVAPAVWPGRGRQRQ